ncbi:MAG: IPExxxVDY family protein [Flavobacteriales bacterium]|nr:IPExxxVDY family protein [Flavobacteriales bacterium]
MPRHRLALTEFDTQATVIGISCHVPDYRLCWSLNRALGTDLARRREDIVELVRGKELHYPVFLQSDAQGMSTWWLIANTCGKRRLISDQKEADFFLLIDAETAEHERDLTDRVRAAEFVLAAFPLAHADLRNGHKLLL